MQDQRNEGILGKFLTCMDESLFFTEVIGIITVIFRLELFFRKSSLLKDGAIIDSIQSF